MLAQPYRLPATAKLTNSRYLKTPFYGVKYAPNNLELSRFGFVVRKTVDKRSVVRNRIRRVLRSCIEEQLESIKPGYDMLFFLEKGIMDKKQADLCQIVAQSLKERSLLK
jgi:ribonuclease P protein component